MTTTIWGVWYQVQVPIAGHLPAPYLSRVYKSEVQAARAKERTERYLNTNITLPFKVWVSRGTLTSEPIPIMEVG